MLRLITNKFLKPRLSAETSDVQDDVANRAPVGGDSQASTKSTGMTELPQRLTPPVDRRWSVDSASTNWTGEVIGPATAFANEHDLPFNIVVLSAFRALLYRYLDGEFTGIAVSPDSDKQDNRESQDPQNYILGVVDTALTSESCFSDWVVHTRKSLDKNATDNDEAGSQASSQQVRIGVQVSGSGTPEFNARQFDLQLCIPDPAYSNPVTGENSQELRVDYSDELFHRADMQSLLLHLQTLILDGVERRTIPVSKLRLMDAEERQTLQRFNATELTVPDQFGMTDLFAEQATRTPDRIAASFAADELTYQQLAQQVDSMAGWLSRYKLAPDDLVAICLPRGLPLLVAQLAVQRLGAAYLPIDPEYPQERIDFIIEDANAALYLTDSTLELSLSGLEKAGRKIPVIELDSALDEILTSDTAAPESIAQPSNLAYVIYTSGSTGKPKGVEITRANLVNQLYAAKQRPDICEQDVLIALTTVAFDVSIVELYLPLICGAHVHIVSRETATDGYQLREALESRGITRMDATPSSWRMLLESGWTGNKELVGLVGGEALPRDLIDELCPKIKSFWNMYGPTETTVSCTAAEVKKSDQRVSIGQPMANYQIHILDSNGQTCPLNVTGEIHIGGKGTARGYLNRPDLTESRFITDPETGNRLYKSGDLGRWMRDGNIECVGRIDSQVKLRGYRIELEEIENALCSIKSVQHAVVTLKANQSSEYLAAYIVPAGGSNSTAGNRAATAQENYSAHLATVLPAYMVPSTYTLLDELPQTPNGKVDLANLPEPQEPQSKLAASNPPLTRTESEVAGLWAELIGTVSINRSDNFFLLGGHSLLAMRFIKMVRENYDVNISAKSLHSETLAEIAAAIRPMDRPASQPPALKPAKPVFTFEPVFFRSGNEHLFGVFHPAHRNNANTNGTATRNQSAILICQPLGHEHQRLQRSIRTLSENLAAAGHDVFRFDYAGTGDSSGDLDQMSLATWRQNTVDALRWLQSRSPRQSLAGIGIRYGAIILKDSVLKDLEKTLFWDPVINGQHWVDDLQRMTHLAMRNLDRFSAIQKHKEQSELFGYLYGDTLLGEISASTLDHSAAVSNCGIDNAQFSNTTWPARLAVIRSQSEDSPGLPEPLVASVNRIEEDLAWREFEVADDMAMAGRCCHAITEWFR